MGMDAVALRHSAWIARCLGRGELAPLAPRDVERLAAELDERRYAGGQLIFRMGEGPAVVHIIRNGHVELSRQLHGRRVALQVLRAGDVFGDIPMLVRMDEPYDARALDDCALLRIDSGKLFELLAGNPRLMRRWLVSVAARMARIQARVVDLLAGGLREQVAAILLREAEHGTVRLAQPVVAELVGSRRTSVNRVLKGLEATGLIRIRYRHVEILDETGLVAVTEGSPADRL
jgi:CRP/FNR family transcriptional regulator, cAMP and macrophage regulator